MNNVIISGNITRNPEVKYTSGENSMAICRFTVAVNEGYGDKQKTSFIPVVVFGKSAENCEKYLSKGSKVLVKGHIQTGSYEKDGRTIYTTDVIADNYGGVEFLSAKSQETTPAEPAAPEGFSAMQDEEIPF